MESSLEQLHSKVEGLTELVLVSVGRENLLRKIADIEREEILNELNALKQLIRTNGRGTVAQQAEQLNLVIAEPNRVRGQYSGLVTGLDYRAILVKCTRTHALEVPLAELENGQERPKFGDWVRLGFNDDALTVSVVERSCQRPTSEKI